MNKGECAAERLELSDVEFAKIGIDSCGRVFKWNGRFFRAIYADMVEDVQTMFSCGMIDELVELRLFPRSWITGFSLEGYGLIIEHEMIKRLSYPFEWSFAMLKDAAITVLRVNAVACKYGYQTKDCHAYNICFDTTTPLFVDLGSFIRVCDNKGWASYQDFLRSYRYPLRFWSQGNSHIARKLLFSLSFAENMPHESYFLYKYPMLRFVNPGRLRQFVALYFRIIGRIPHRFFDFKKLIDTISSLSLQKGLTNWGNYHDTYFDKNGEPVPNRRFERIIELIKNYDINSVVELGGNQGTFSEMLIKKTSIRDVICTDNDDNAVDVLFGNARHKGLRITTALVDVVYPLMNYYEKPPFDRFKADAVVALALTHHLVLGQHLSIELFFEIVSKYSSRYVFIEFMPLGLWSGAPSAPLPSWYCQEWFKTAFEKYFTLHLIETLEENRVLFFGELPNRSAMHGHSSEARLC